jgi:hypothetical protein
VAGAIFIPMSAPTSVHPLVAHAVGLTHQVAQSVQETWDFTNAMLGEHLGTILGFVLALLVIGRLMLEKRNPSNVFAWGLLMLFVPWLGVPLYFLFGGRKSRRLAQGTADGGRAAAAGPAAEVRLQCVSLAGRRGGGVRGAAERNCAGAAVHLFADVYFGAGRGCAADCGGPGGAGAGGARGEVVD